MKKMLSLAMAAIMLLGIITVFSAPIAYAESDQSVVAQVNGISTQEIGNVRVQVLSDSLVRIEVKGTNGYEDRPSYHVVNRNDWPSADATVVTEGGVTKIATANYTIVVPQAATSLSGIYMTDKRGGEIWRYSSLPSGSVYLPSPGATPKAWAIADNPRVIPATWGYRPMPAENTQFTDYNGWDTTNNSPDMFVFVPNGDSKKLRDDFTSLTGPSDLIPLKSLGLWHSRYYAYTEQSALNWIDTYRAHNFPLDYFVVDTDWRTGASLGYIVNTNYFPDMPRFIQRAHDKNVQIMFNDHPEPEKDNNGNRLQSLAQKEVVYRNNMLKSIFDMGLDVWWYDRNWSTSLVSPFGVPKESFGMYLYQAITADYWEDHKGNELYARRPMIMGNVDGIDNGVFNKAPDLASHRFSIQWTGDTHGQASDLKQEIVDIVKSSAVTSTPYMSSDIAGHMDVLGSGQWTRWSQYAAFSPFIRYHCTSGNNLDRSPWLYGVQAENIARDYINMRYRLLPLYYSLAHENYENGMPLIRRLDYNYPQYAEAQDDTTYTLGDNILVAPIWEAAGEKGENVPGSWLQTSSGQPGLFAQYYHWSGSATAHGLDGTPVLERVETTVNYADGSSKPATEVNATNFSARYSGKITIGSQDAKIAFTHDDGARVIVDGEVVIDSWIDTATTTSVSSKVFSANSTHDIVIEFYQAGGGWAAQLKYVTVANSKDSRSVFIPDGRWIDVWTGEEFVGPKTITVSHDIETSPIFVRSGSIIPLAENVSYIGEKPWSTIGLDVYPSVVLDGKSELYEDDGDSVGYRDGQFRKTSLETTSENGEILVKIGSAVGPYSGPSQRTWKVRVHAPASWGNLLSATLDSSAVAAVKLVKSSTAQPFAIEGSARDADVYEITFTSSVSTPHSIRLGFEHPVAETVPVSGGIPVDFSVADSIAPANVNLTTNGEWDWAHYGTDGAQSTTLKANVSNRIIGALSTTGTPNVASGYTEFKWTDGNTAPASRLFIKNGLTLSDGSFEFDLKVDTNQEKIALYIGGDSASGKLSISDGKSAKFVDASNTSGVFAKKVLITAVADEPATLHVKYAKTGGTGNIAIYAVAVSNPTSVNDIPIERFASIENITGRIDLSTGSTDWVHLGYGGVASAVNRKAGANQQLLAPVVSGGSFQVTDYNGSNNSSNGGSYGTRYTGGTSPASVTNNQNAIAKSDGYFQISAPSTKTWRALKIYLGVWQATNRIEISDESGVELNSYEISASGSSPNVRCLTLTYRSNEDSNIIIKMSRISGSGNISLCGYALYDIGSGDQRSALEPVSGVITFDGASDWVHLGYGNNASVINRKAGVTTQILSDRVHSNSLTNVSDYNSVYGGTTYSDGTNPVSVNGNQNAVQQSTTGGYIEFTAQSAPDSAWRRLDVYMGAWNACNRIEVMDSNRNLLAVYEYTATSPSQLRRLGVLYRDCGGQIIVRLTKVSGSGNVCLAAYSVYDVKALETSAAVTVEPAPATNLNLSEANYIDWAHFGYQAADRFNHKTSGPKMVGNPVCLLSQNLDRSNDFTTNFSWNDGSVNTTVNNTRDFSYSFDGMKFSMNVKPGVWKFSIYTSVWWAKGYILFQDETGNIIGTANYESKAAQSGTSEYRRVNLIYSSDEAHTITVRNMPALAFDSHRGNMSFAAVTVEQFIDHVWIDGGDAPDIRTTLAAKAYVSPDESLEFFSYDGVTFKWQRSESASGPFVDIPGATNANYKPTAADVGYYLRVEAVFAGKTVYRVTDQPVSNLIFAPVFVDGKGNTCANMLDKPFAASLRYYNRTAAAETLTMYVAIYDANQRLKYINADTKTIEPDGLIKFEVPLNFALADGDFAKVMLLDNNYTPTRAAYLFE